MLLACYWLLTGSIVISRAPEQLLGPGLAIEPSLAPHSSFGSSRRHPFLAAAVVFFGCLPIHDKDSLQSSWASSNLHILSKANLLGHRGQLLSGTQIPLPDVGPMQDINFDLWGTLSSSWGKSCRCRKERLCNGWPQTQQKHVSGLWRACQTSGSTTCSWARCAPSPVRTLPPLAVTTVVLKPPPSLSASPFLLARECLPCNAKRAAPYQAVTNSGSTCVWPAETAVVLSMLITFHSWT